MPLYRESFIFRIETETPGTFWSGHGDLLLPADSILPADTVAVGGGSLVNLPDLDQLINGIAQRVDVTFSGVSQDVLPLVLEDALSVPGAAVYIGRIQFDALWQQAAPVEWEWSGEARSLTVQGEAGQGDAGRTRTVVLRVAAGDTARSRAPLTFFTDAEQRRNFPTDNFFANVGAINSGTSRRWGPT